MFGPKNKNHNLFKISILNYVISKGEKYLKKYGIDSNYINIKSMNLWSGTYLLKINADENILDKELVIKNSFVF